MFVDESGASGRGFVEGLPGKLPPQAFKVLVNISLVDHVMEKCRDRRLSDEQLKKVVDVRNRAYHELLCLPSWEELLSLRQERCPSQGTIYECCRLTAILYSTAVIFPQPPHSGWHVKLVQDIIALLTPETIDTWSRAAPSLLLWVLVVSLSRICLNTPAQRPKH
jgi:hypothetical protein